MTTPNHHPTLPLAFMDTELCALCGGQGGSGISVPVFDQAGRPAVRRICQPCLSSVLGVSLQLMGHAPAKVAAIVAEMHTRGRT